MTHNRALGPLSIAASSEAKAPLEKHLTGEQLEALSRCANGISLRFERSELVDALVDSGYAQKGVAGVITVTAEGRQYLRMHAPRLGSAAQALKQNPQA